MFSAVYRFFKSKPVFFAIPAAIVGVVAASAVTAIIVKHFESGAPEKYFSSYSFNSSVFTEASEPEPQEIVEVNTVPAVIQPVQKQVAYKGKKINVPKVEVAKADSKEDNKNGSYVAEKPQNVASKTATINISACKGNPDYIYGIDVSSHNGSIDWAAVKKSGVQFAMIRCGYRGYLTGKIVMDATFEYNILNAYKNGIPVGIYFYSTAVNETEAVEEAAYVTELIKKNSQHGIKVSYPVAYDFEEFYNNDERSRAKTLSKSQISSNAAAFLDYIKTSGYTPMFYAGKNPMKDNFEAFLASRYNFWLANYANATEYAGRFFMWQFTSSGEVGGVQGRVDMNVCGFENSDNNPRFSICAKEGAVGYKKPDSSDEAVLNLKSGEAYLYRNTYSSNFKEVKVDGKYAYVPSSCLVSPFETPENEYTTAFAEYIYRYPIDDSSYKTNSTITSGVLLDVTGIWEDKWAEVKYAGKVCYIKADRLIIGKKTGDTSSGEPSGSEENNSSGEQTSTGTQSEPSSQEGTPAPSDANSPD